MTDQMCKQLSAILFLLPHTVHSCYDLSVLSIKSVRMSSTTFVIVDFLSTLGKRVSKGFMTRLFKYNALWILLLIAFLFPCGAMAKPCPKVKLGGQNWDSARFHAAVASYLLEHGYGCKTETVPGAVLPLLTALGQGDVHVLMEVWVPNVKAAWTKLRKEGKVVDVGVNFPDAVQGFYVPRYLIEGDKKRKIPALAPNLRSVFDLKKHKQLFKDPEKPNKGRFFNCILGWAREAINSKKLVTYGLSKDYVDFKPGTEGALAAAISSRYEQGKPFLSYYWGPSWIVGKYDLVMLKEPPYNKDIWTKLVKEKEPKAATAYPMVKVRIGMNQTFARENPGLKAFFSRYRTSNAMISRALVYLQDNKGSTPKDAALHFLKNNQKIWKKWLSPAAYKKVSEQLSARQTKKKRSLDISEPINDFVAHLVRDYGQFFRNVAKPILSMILIVENLLMAFPWWVFALLMGALAFWLGGGRLFVTVLFCFLSIEALGLWELSMQTLALMMISTIVSTLIGLPLGVLSAKSERFRSALLPILDAMQTMPSFVYLIPALMLFGLGKVPAVFATVIYAVVPTIRLTDLGIREVDETILEAAHSFGATSKQVLWEVELPLALPTIMAGINQSIMMALGMVVIASMIGARGLGEQVLLGIQKLDVGKGFTAGLGIVLLAIFLERMTQSIGKLLDNTR